MARRKIGTGSKKAPSKKAKLVEYADDEPSAFAEMLGGLIAANVEARPEKQHDFETLKAKVGIWVTDINEGVTLDFKGGLLNVHNGLKPRRKITIRTDAETVMNLSNLKIGLFGMPVYFDDVGRGVALKLFQGKLHIDGLLANIATVNAVTRIFSVQ